MVRDGETGAPLPDAAITLPELDRLAYSDSLGAYRFLDVPPGPHHLSAQHLGYASRTLHAIVPASGELRINIHLRPDPIPVAGIYVRGLTPLRDTENQPRSPNTERWMTLSAVRNHPLLSEPDVLLALGGGQVFASPESPNGIHIRGGSSDQTSFLLDGIPVFNPYHVAGLFSAWNPDALSNLFLSAAAPSPAFPEALSGTVGVLTRDPGPELRAQGGLSTSNARVTVDGPLGGGGGGYLLSLRSGFPGGVTRIGEPSYLRGESGDGLVSLRWPFLEGDLHLTAYGNQNEIEAASSVQRPDTAPGDPSRNAFRWDGRSLGVEWSRELPSGRLRARGWRASAHATSHWAGSEGVATRLRSLREDLGFVLEGEGEHLGGSSSGGVRIEDSRTSYRVRSAAAANPPLALGATTTVLAPFLRHHHSWGEKLEVELAASLPIFAGRSRISPRARLVWAPSRLLTLTGNYARLFQFSQSLRNAESVVGNVFPADLFLGAGAPGVPVARAHQGVVILDVRPRRGVRFSAQIYRKASAGLLLVAPAEGDPFSTGSFVTGTGSTSGLSLEGAVSGTRYGITASYGWQRVRLEHDGGAFQPQWGAAHMLEAGAIFFPSPSSSLRMGITSDLGRRTTAVDGLLEWESCNLLDRGCEFGGSPSLGENPRGGVPLPAYLRLDLGAERHWHLRVGKRDALLSIFGTVTNLFGRKNLLTFATDPSTGRRIGIEMRPISPLVVGLDWRY